MGAGTAGSVETAVAGETCRFPLVTRELNCQRHDRGRWEGCHGLVVRCGRSVAVWSGRVAAKVAAHHACDAAEGRVEAGEARREVECDAVRRRKVAVDRRQHPPATAGGGGRQLAG